MLNLFFLDYIAVDKLKIKKIKKILNGIVKGCTVHYVNDKLDSENIILQKKVRVDLNDN